MSIIPISHCYSLSIEALDWIDVSLIDRVMTSEPLFGKRSAVTAWHFCTEWVVFFNQASGIPESVD
jgi:hypothetical protein